MANSSNLKTTSTVYEWVGKHPHYNERLPVTQNMFRARLKLVSYALEEVEFLSQTSRSSQTHTASIDNWIALIQEILANRDVWVFQDPHGFTWRLFQEESDGTRRMILS